MEKTERFLIFFFLSLVILYGGVVWYMTEHKTTQNKLLEQVEEVSTLKEEIAELREEITKEPELPSRSMTDLDIIAPPVAAPQETTVFAPEPTPSPAPKKAKENSSDVAELARIIYCEAGGSSEQDKRAVGQVVLNRAKKYGKSIRSTIYEKNVNGVYVFSPVAKKSYSSTKYDKACETIAKELLAGKVYSPVGKALYFCTVAHYNTKGWHYQHVKSGKGKITLKTKKVVYIE